MMLAAGNSAGVWVFLALVLTIVVIRRQWVLRAERRRPPPEPVSGRAPDAWFHVGVRFGSRKGSLPHGRLSTYDGFVVIALSGAAPIRLDRADGVSVHTARSIATLGLPEIELQPARGPHAFRLRIIPQPRDAEALESALRRSLGPASV